MHQEHIANTMAHGGRMALAGVISHTCKNEPEVKKVKSGSCSMPLTWGKDSN